MRVRVAALSLIVGVAIAALPSCAGDTTTAPSTATDTGVSSHGDPGDTGPPNGQGGANLGDYSYPVALLPGASDCPSDSNEPRRTSDPRSWYSTAYRGRYGGASSTRCVGSGSHPGVDIRVPDGTNVFAVAAGKVVVSKPEASSGGWGELIMIQHPGLPVPAETVYSVYAHLQQRLVLANAQVTAGQLIGYSGHTGNVDGPHLHFQVDRHRRPNGTTFSHSTPYWPGTNYGFSDTKVRTTEDADQLPAQIPTFTYDPVRFIADLAHNAPPPPSISLSASSLSFTGQQGGNNPNGQTLSISNTGGGTLNWSASSNQSWLMLSATSGAAPSSLTVSVNTTGLTAGTYNATISLVASGATNTPQTVAVSLTVTTAAPTIGLSATTLSFSGQQAGSNPAGQSLSISNTGGGTLSWAASSNQSWLTLSSSSGTGPSTITVFASTGGLAAGNYSGTITVSANGATNTPQTVVVSLTVTTAAPTIGLSVTGMSFAGQQGAASPSGQALSITNVGGGTLTWSASTNQSWLTLSSTGGTAPSTLTVFANTAGLAAGSYSGIVTVSAGGATNTPRTVAVTLTVTTAAPTIGLSSTSLSFAGQQGGSSPAGQSLSISNTGGGTLNWNASSNQNWLTLSTASGAAPSTVTVLTNTTGLTAGSYSGAITVSANGATNTPQTIAVTLTVTTAAPSIGLSATNLGFMGQQNGANPSGQTLSITNVGGGTLSWSASSDQSWLTLSATSGTAPSSVTVSVNTAGLTAGTYSGAISVSASGATNTPRTVAVSLTLTTAAPTIGLSATNLSFTGQQGGSNPSGQTLSISNTSSGTLGWTASTNQSWLTVSSTNGTAPSTITVSANTAGLAAGNYNGTITVSATGATNTPQSVSVGLTVTQAQTRPNSPSSLLATWQTGSLVSLAWARNSTNETSFQLERGTSSGGPWTTVSSSIPAGNTLAVDTPSPAPYPYWYRISACNGAGCSTPSSVAPALFPAPTQSQPSNSATGVSRNATFSWSGVSGANRYWLMVSTNSADFPTDPFASNCGSGCIVSAIVTGTSYTIPNAPLQGRTSTLAANTTYYWKVQAYYDNGGSVYTQGVYSTLFVFRTGP